MEERRADLGRQQKDGHEIAPPGRKVHKILSGTYKVVSKVHELVTRRESEVEQDIITEVADGEAQVELREKIAIADAVASSADGSTEGLDGYGLGEKKVERAERALGRYNRVDKGSSSFGPTVFLQLG